jgi:GAF domain-containing protein
MLIVHQCDRPRRWQEWEIDLLQQLSSRFAIAIQRANLFNQLQLELQERQLAEIFIRQQADKETLLHEIMQRIRQSLDLHTIFDTATSEIRQFLQADRVGHEWRADSQSSHLLPQRQPHDATDGECRSE